MKIREYEIPQANNKKHGNDPASHRDPMIKPKGLNDRFVPPSIENDPLAGKRLDHQDRIVDLETRQIPPEDNQVEQSERAHWKAKRKLKRRKRILRRLGPVFVVFLLFLAWLFLRLAPVPFGTVLVDGNEKMTFADVYRVSGVKNYVNVVQLSPSDMEDKLSHDLRVAEVKVSRELPATIRVTMEERKATAVVTTLYGFAYLDKFGVVIALEPQIKGVSVPLLTGMKMDTLLLGDIVTDNTVQSALGYLQSLSPRGLHGIAEVNVGNPQKIIAYTTDSVPVRLGSGDRPEERAKITEELLQEVETNQLAVQYIDTDVNAPLVKSK